MCYVICCNTILVALACSTKSTAPPSLLHPKLILCALHSFVIPTTTYNQEGVMAVQSMLWALLAWSPWSQLLVLFFSCFACLVPLVPSTFIQLNQTAAAAALQLTGDFTFSLFSLSLL